MPSPSNLVMQRAWRGIGWFGIALLFYLSLTPKPPTIQLDHGDKLGHFLAYCVLTFWWAQGLTGKRQRLYLALGIIALGVVLEFAQGWTGWRSFDYYDMLANAAGVVAGTIMATMTPNVFALARRFRLRAD